ncbi:hypothetical protein [Caminibacter pacificus]
MIQKTFLYLFIIYLLPWIIMLFFYLLYPADIEKSTLVPIFLSFVHVFTIVITSLFAIFLFLKYLPNRISHLDTVGKNALHPFFSKNLKVIVTVCLIILWMGIFFHFYDKMVIRGYDYFNECINEIRDRWLQDGISRNGKPSSWQSIAGYVFFSFYFVSIWFIVLWKQYFSKRFYIITLVLSWIPVILFSYSLGSRSILVFCAAFFISLHLTSLLKTTFFVWIKENFLNVTILIFILSLYIAGTMALRMSNCGKNIDKLTPSGYIGGYQKELGIKLLKNIGDKNENSLNLTVLYTIGLYMNNGIWNFEHLYNTHLEGIKTSPITLRPIEHIKRKIGFSSGSITEDGVRGYKKGNIALTGALWNDFGLFGLILIAFLVGLSLSIAFIAIAGMSEKIGLYAKLWLTIIGTIYLLSPLTYPPSLLAFPSFAISICIIAILITIGYKNGQIVQKK